MPLLSTFANAGARGYGLAGVGLATSPIIGTATATSATSASVTFSPPLSDGGSPITSYTAVASPGGQSATVYQSGGGTISVAGLSQGIYYTFSVYATNALGNSPPSASSNEIRTFGVPDAPTIGFASVSGSTSVNVSYTAPTYNGGSTITSYTAVSSPGGYTGTVATSASGSILVSGLQASTSYAFQVYASNVYGSSSYSGYSNTVTTTAIMQVTINPTERVVNIPRQTTSVTTYGTFAVSQVPGTGTGDVYVQEISRPGGDSSTSISPTLFSLGAGGSQNVTVGCTSPNGSYTDAYFQYDFAILVAGSPNPYPIYSYYQNRV